MFDASSNRYNMPIRVIAFITLVAFLFTSVPADLVQASSLNPRQSVSSFSLPPELGTVQNSWFASKPINPNAQFPTIIHIQDAHCNYDAQRKIAEIIGYLNRTYGINMVNLEGGKGGYDLSIFKAIDDSDRREQIADQLTREGLINGAEYFAGTNIGKVTLWGIEDDLLYLENLRIYRQSLRHKDEIDKYLKTLSRILSSLKIHIYSKELLEFDSKYAQYKAGNLEFKAYVAVLLALAKRRAIKAGRYDNLTLLGRVIEKESGIEFKKANGERYQLIESLRKALSYRETGELVQNTVAFSSGKMAQASYYAYVRNKAKEVGIDTGVFPEFEKYLDYIDRFSEIDNSKVMSEVASLELQIKSALFENGTQRELDTLSKNLAITKNIFNVTLTREDHRYYLANEASFGASNYIAFINREAPRYKIEAGLGPEAGNIDRYREDASKFYGLSMKRDEAFMRNIRFSVNRQPSTVNKREVTIVITGGFHGENLCELFKKNGMSYVSILPNFRVEDGYKCPYFKLLSGNPYAEFIKTAQSLGLSALSLPSSLNGLGKQAAEAGMPLSIEKPAETIRPVLVAPPSSLLGSSSPASLAGPAVPTAAKIPKQGFENLGKEIKSFDFKINYASRKNPNRMTNLLKIFSKVWTKITKAVTEAQIGADNVVNGDVIANALDAIFKRLDREYELLDDFEKYQFNEKGHIYFRVLRDETTGASSFVLSNNGDGIPRYVIAGWANADPNINNGEPFYETTTRAVNPVENPVYFGGRGMGVYSFLSKARNKFEVSFKTGQKGAKTGYIFTQRLDGTRELREVPKNKNDFGTDLIMTLPAPIVPITGVGASQPAAPPTEAGASQPAISQIGKRAKGEITDDLKLKVTTSDGKVNYVDLVEYETLDVKWINDGIRNILRLPDAKKQTIAAILSLLEKSPPKLYAYTAPSEQVKDLFGIVSPQHNLIAMHTGVIMFYPAIFHEIGEYLIAKGDIAITLDASDTITIVDKKSSEVIAKVPITAETKSVMRERGELWVDGAIPGEYRNHYYLRMLQGELFGTLDYGITNIIQVFQGKKNAGPGDMSGESTIAGLPEVTRPLSDPRIINDKDVNNIFVISSGVGQENPKLGEAIINTWPLVLSLHKKFPKATIYVATPFPDPYFAEYFKGKIKPIPIKPLESLKAGSGRFNKWDNYVDSEWKGFTVGDMWSFPQTPKIKTIKAFINAKKIDMVVDVYDLEPVAKRMAPADFDGGRMPYIFDVHTPAGSIWGMKPEFYAKERETKAYAPVFRDRAGKEHKITGYRELLEKIAPGGSVVTEGVWRFAMGIYATMGLDIDDDSLGALELSLKERNGALTLLKEWYEKNNKTPRPFDPLKKIFVVNVYASTHSNIISDERWADIITGLLKDTDAYIVFTQGGPMDEDSNKVERILSLVDSVASNRIILPRQDLYPVISDILGIADWVLTIDTGMSHFASGIYNRPTTILTKMDIKHWLTPRTSNATPVFSDNPIDFSILYHLGHGDNLDYETVKKLKEMLHKTVVKDVLDQARAIYKAPMKADVVAARLSALSIVGRALLDAELLKTRLQFTGAEDDLRSYMAPYLESLGLNEKLIPAVAFVDSAAQMSIDLPRFRVKLHLNELKTYILIDKSSLAQKQDGSWAARDDIKNFDILHEMLGHMFVRSRFPEFERIYKTAIARGVESDEVVIAMTTEEILARLMTLLAYRRIKELKPGFRNEVLEEKLKTIGVDINSLDLQVLIGAIIRRVLAIDDDLNVYKYKKALQNKETTKTIMQDVTRKADALIQHMKSLGDKASNKTAAVSGKRMQKAAIYDDAIDVKKAVAASLDYRNTPEGDAPRQTIDIADKMRLAQEILEPPHSRKIRFEVDTVSGSIPKAMLTGDTNDYDMIDLIRMVLANAIYFDANVVIRAFATTDGRPAISISDTGPGVNIEMVRTMVRGLVERGKYESRALTVEQVDGMSDEEVLLCIFDKHVTTKDRPDFDIIMDAYESQGRGIGLAAVASIMKRSHGEIRVETRKEVGASFTFIFEPYSKPVSKITQAEAVEKKPLADAKDCVTNIYAAAKDVVVNTRYPDERRVICIPISEKICPIDTVRNKVQEIWKDLRPDVGDKGFRNITLLFYDGSLKNLNEKLSDLAAEGITFAKANTLAYIDASAAEREPEEYGRLNDMKAKGQISMVREAIPQEGAYISVGGHVILALGILDIVRNGRSDPDYISFVATLAAAMSDGQPGTKVEDYKELLKNGDIAGILLRLPPAKKIDINADMEAHFLMEEGAMKSL